MGSAFELLCMPTLRFISPADDPRMASIIRTVMPELGAHGPGFAIHDAEVDSMSASYARPLHAYFAKAASCPLARRLCRTLGGSSSSFCEDPKRARKSHRK